MHVKGAVIGAFFIGRDRQMIACIVPQAVVKLCEHTHFRGYLRCKILN